MKRLVDRFAFKAAACGNSDDLRTLLDAACLELGFSHFALLHHASLSSSSAGYIRLDNYPSEWVRELTVTGMVVDDPVHIASRRANTGFSWAELPAIIELGPRQQHILTRSHAFGLEDGFTIPVNVPGEPGGSCSFAVRSGLPFPAARLRCAELIGAHAFRAARRIHRLGRGPVRPHLSRRELQCLRLLALGKTDWEIARILGIGRETVRTYVKHARERYGVATRTQLAIHALRDEHISFEEAVPDRLEAVPDPSVLPRRGE